MGGVAGEKYLFQQQGTATAVRPMRERETYGCEEYRDLYLHWETIGCRVAVVARSTETYTCTGRPMVAGLRWLLGVQRLIPALGDHWLQWLQGVQRLVRVRTHGYRGCGGCDEYRDV